MILLLVKFLAKEMEMRYALNHLQSIKDKHSITQYISYVLASPHLENPADLSRPVFICGGLCRDTPQLIYKNVACKLKSQPHGQAHLFFADTQANAEKQKSLPFPTTTRNDI